MNSNRLEKRGGTGEEMAGRLDVFLVEQGYFPSREKARRAVLEGKVSINGALVSKPSYPVRLDAEILVSDTDKYVGRGGLKLEKALRVFSISVEGKTCLDIGASTGGFTQCCLLHGAQKVYAVDVGSSQLDPSLRQDGRVVSLEQTDARRLTREAFPDVEFICTDVSFISVRLILPVIGRLLPQDGVAVVLIKPQFEAGRAFVGRGGIVRGRDVHVRVIDEVVQAAQQEGLCPQGIDYSPVASGNTEYLLHLGKQKSGLDVKQAALQTAQEAEEFFHGKK